MFFQVPLLAVPCAFLFAPRDFSVKYGMFLSPQYKNLLRTTQDLLRTSKELISHIQDILNISDYSGAIENLFKAS